MCVCVKWVPLRSRINSTKSPASGAGKISESRFFLISNFRRVVNVVLFLLGDSGAGESPKGKNHKSGYCAKSCARRSACFCSQSGGGAGIGLLT